MGAAYINNCIPKDIKNLKSLYLVVKEDMIMPNPNEKRAIIRINNGIIKTE